MKYILIILFVTAAVLMSSCKKEETVEHGTVSLVSLQAGDVNIGFTISNINIPFNEPFVAVFDKAIDTIQIADKIYLRDDQNNLVKFSFTVSEDGKTLEMLPLQQIAPLKNYFFVFTDEIKGAQQEIFEGMDVLFTTMQSTLSLLSAVSQEINLLDAERITDVSLMPSFKITFNQALNKETINASTVRLAYPGANIPLAFSFENDDQTVLITTTSQLDHYQRFLLDLSTGIVAVDGSVFDGFSVHFYTELDSTPKFPVISDDDLLTLVQHQTFKYFWDFGHPVSGMARERNTSGDIVTSGGTGFCIMGIPVAIERGFITRSEGVDRLETIVNFLDQADRFHGAWSHWINGSTGQAIPFGTQDNGGDLIETAFLIQGLLTVRQYLNPMDIQEGEIITLINELWEEVEWTWYTRGGQNVLYWHWSPNYEWAMNMQIRGYNEGLIAYILAASSPTYPITAAVYHSGWANNGQMANGNSYFGIELPLGYSYGGPLFFAHYSFLGLDPRNLSDNYANYWTQNTNHSLINQAYCEANPKSWVGYSSEAWGLTASDNQNGYSAHSPTNDLGVITPTAAVSSLPYTPVQSMEAIRFFYYKLGDKLWGDYGFYDAYNITESWIADSYIAIDQGPMVVMIENYRTGLLWDLFMTCPELSTGFQKLSFTH